MCAVEGDDCYWRAIRRETREDSGYEMLEVVDCRAGGNVGDGFLRSRLKGGEEGQESGEFVCGWSSEVRHLETMWQATVSASPETNVQSTKNADLAGVRPSSAPLALLTLTAILTGFRRPTRTS